MKAYLQLENGAVFEGNAFGNIDETVGEVVFNTGMTGYQEIMTDPSYYGQIVVMTYPLIGNYGINLDDDQSDGPKVRGLIVRERSKNPSNFRCELDLEGYMKHNQITGLEGVDTRSITKMIRQNGTLRGIITLKRLPKTKLMESLKGFDNTRAVDKVTVKRCYSVDGKGKHIAVLDYGIKKSIIDSFVKRGLRLTVFPANTPAEDVLKSKPDGVFLSNGPGDPKNYKGIVDNVRRLVDQKPTMGICLGHQLIALALGGDTAKLKFGHRGCNHPVKDLAKGRVYITSQNHGYVVNRIPENMEVTHRNLNDNTVEGLRHISKPVFSVQFHPEASPGPDDACEIIDEFIRLL